MDWLVVIFIIFFISYLFRNELQGKGESSNDFGKRCLFSDVSGVIKLDGEPATGAKLVRKAGSKTDATVTNDGGYFRFNALYERSIMKFIPSEFCAAQVITVHYQGYEYRMWSSVKREPEENTESKGKPLVVDCELASDESLIMVGGVGIFSLCTWDVEPDAKIDFFTGMEINEN